MVTIPEQSVLVTHSVKWISISFMHANLAKLFIFCEKWRQLNTLWGSSRLVPVGPIGTAQANCGGMKFKYCWLMLLLCMICIRWMSYYAQRKGASTLHHTHKHRQLSHTSGTCNQWRNNRKYEILSMCRIYATVSARQSILWHSLKQ